MSPLWGRLNHQLSYPSSHELFVFLSPLLVFLFPSPFCRSIRTPGLKWHYFDCKGLKDDNRFAKMEFRRIQFWSLTGYDLAAKMAPNLRSGYEISVGGSRRC